MVKRFNIGLVLLLVMAVFSCTDKSKQNEEKDEVAQLIESLPDSIYLMSYFKAPAQHLFYAYSADGLNWTDINKSNPVFDAYDGNIWMRDPYMKRVNHKGKTKFHLIHTWGWDNPAIFHWESDDLITWKATNGGMTTDDGKIYVMDGKNGNGKSINSWAPEFTYDPATETFYIYWASDNGSGYLQHWYCTTQDWVEFTPSKIYFDPGFTTIDMTILPYKGTYYAFYKDERNGEKKIRLATTKSLNPEVEKLEGNLELFPGYPEEVEGPEVFKAIGEDKWFMYWDKFNGDKGISFAVCTDPEKKEWVLVPDDQVTEPSAVKHGSVEIISREELHKILNYYNFEERTYLPTADKEVQDWKYTTDSPADDWYTTNFDDSSWETGKGTFGSEDMNDIKIRTRWTTEDIWLRKTFRLGALSAEELELITLRIAHDDEAEVYINGILAAEASGYTTDYKSIELSAEAKKALIQNGENVIAIHGWQDSGAQHVDAGLIAIIPARRN